MSKKLIDKKEIAVQIEDLYKSFRIPNEKHTSLKSAALNVFKKKGYTIYEAAKGISFEIRKGEFFGIIGQNGSGKSTLLKMLAGIYTPDKGKISIIGKLSPFLELGVGFNPELTARENVYLGGAILGLSRKEIDEKFDKIIRFAELQKFVDMKFKNFSSGMQVRLAFSLAVQAHSDIILIDEVLAVGDTNFQEKCFQVFRNLKREGKTVVFVSHGMDSVRKFCDRVALLDKGNLVFLGDPSQAVLEYSRLNMETTFEEKQEVTKEAREEKKVLAKKENEIKKAVVLNIKGKESKFFLSGEPLSLSISLQLKNPAKDLNMGVAIYEAETVCRVAGFNTFFDKKKLSFKAGDNNILLKIKDNLKLNEGKFFILVSLFLGDPDQNRLVDFYDSRLSGFFFQFKSKTRTSPGILGIAHEWESINE